MANQSPQEEPQFEIPEELQQGVDEIIRAFNSPEKYNEEEILDLLALVLVYNEEQITKAFEDTEVNALFRNHNSRRDYQLHSYFLNIVQLTQEDLDLCGIERIENLKNTRATLLLRRPNVAFEQALYALINAKSLSDDFSAHVGIRSLREILNKRETRYLGKNASFRGQIVRREAIYPEIIHRGLSAEYLRIEGDISKFELTVDPSLVKVKFREKSYDLGDLLEHIDDISFDDLLYNHLKRFLLLKEGEEKSMTGDYIADQVDLENPNMGQEVDEAVNLCLIAKYILNYPNNSEQELLDAMLYNVGNINVQKLLGVVQDFVSDFGKATASVPNDFTYKYLTDLGIPQGVLIDRCLKLMSTCGVLYQQENMTIQRNVSAQPLLVPFPVGRNTNLPIAEFLPGIIEVFSDWFFNLQFALDEVEDKANKLEKKSFNLYFDWTNIRRMLADVSQFLLRSMYVADLIGNISIEDLVNDYETNGDHILAIRKKLYDLHDNLEDEEKKNMIIELDRNLNIFRSLAIFYQNNPGSLHRIKGQIIQRGDVVKLQDEIRSFGGRAPRNIQIKNWFGITHGTQES